MILNHASAAWIRWLAISTRQQLQTLLLHYVNTPLVWAAQILWHAISTRRQLQTLCLRFVNTILVRGAQTSWPATLIFMPSFPTLANVFMRAVTGPIVAWGV